MARIGSDVAETRLTARSPPNMSANLHPMDMDRIAGRLLALSALGAALCAAAPARADLRMCNNTSNRVSVALGYTDGKTGSAKAGGT